MLFLKHTSFCFFVENKKEVSCRDLFQPSYLEMAIAAAITDSVGIIEPALVLTVLVSRGHLPKISGGSPEAVLLPNDLCWTFTDYRCPYDPGSAFP